LEGLLLLAALNLVVSIVIGLFLLFSGYSLSKLFLKEESSFFSRLIIGLVIVCALIVFPSILIGVFGGLQEYFLLVVIGFATSSCYLMVSLARKNIRKRINPLLLILSIVFIIVVFLRPLLLLGGAGIIGWDSLHSYLPQAKQIFSLNEIPFMDLARPGLAFTKPPAAILMYSFTYIFTSSLETSLAISIVSVVGLGLISAELVYRKEKTFKLPLLAMALAISMPLLNYFFFEAGTYLDLPFAFFFLSSIYFLMRTLEVQDRKYSLLFWASFALAMLAKDIAIPFSIAYLIIFGFYSSKAILSVLLANFIIGTYLLLGILNIVPFDWVPFNYILISFLFLFSLQLYISQGVKSSSDLLTSFKTLFNWTILLMAFPLFWLLRSWYISGSISSAFSQQVNVIPYLLFAMSVFAILFLFSLKYKSNKKAEILMFKFRNSSHRLLRHFPDTRTYKTLNMFAVVFFLILGLYYLAAFKIFDVETMGFSPLSPLIYFFLSGWFGSAFIFPKLYGIFVGIKENNKDLKMLLCVSFLILILWSIIGLTSIRYIVVLVPISSIITIKGLSSLSSFGKIKNSILLFFGVLSSIILFASLNYLDQPLKTNLSVWNSDILKDASILPESLALSCIFVLLILIMVTDGSRIRSKLMNLMRRKK
jgi:hypothetical protein